MERSAIVVSINSFRVLCVAVWYCCVFSHRRSDRTVDRSTEDTHERLLMQKTSYPIGMPAVSEAIRVLIGGTSGNTTSRHVRISVGDQAFQSSETHTRIAGLRIRALLTIGWTWLIDCSLRYKIRRAVLISPCRGSVRGGANDGRNRRFYLRCCLSVCDLM